MRRKIAVTIHWHEHREEKKPTTKRVYLELLLS